MYNSAADIERLMRNATAAKLRRAEWDEFAASGLTGGEMLRRVRLRLGLSVRDVYRRSKQIAQAHNDNAEFVILPGRLSDIETKGVVPSVYKLHALCLIYDVTWDRLLKWYGMEFPKK